jgi:hypothetical protein
MEPDTGPDSGTAGGLGQLDWLLAYEMAVLISRSGEHIRVSARGSAFSGWA